MALVGWVDRCSAEAVEGWAGESDPADRPVAVEVFVGSRPAARALAYHYRPDLDGAGYGDARKGFVCPIPARAFGPADRAEVRVCFAGTGEPVPNGVFTVDAPSGRGDPAPDDLLPGVADLVPPAELDFVGGVDFVRVGRHFFDLFVGRGGLRPTDRVLDVGCGIGRMAIPLTDYLTPPGRYDGFDVVPAGIDWCWRKITPRFPHFRFALADVRNDLYNPVGGAPASEYRFPYPDGSFDFVFLTSVFTHLMPADLDNYLRECARVLDAGGRLFGTFFLLNPESERLIAAGQSTRPFARAAAGCRYESDEHPEFAVGYEEDAVRRRLDALGLRVREPIGYGNWSGRQTDYVSYQDIVVAEKVG